MNIHNEHNPPTVAVLDIDLTLVCTVNDGDDGITHDYLNIYNNYDSLRSQLYSFDLINKDEGNLMFMWGLRRPYLKEFLAYMRNNYDYVVIWTAGTQDYAYKVLNEALDGMNFAPDLFWTRKDCEDARFEGDLVYTKPLSKLSNHFGFSMDNAILIDDQPYSHIANSKQSRIQIPQYDPTVENPITNDTYLLQLMEWLRSGDGDNNRIFEEKWVKVNPPIDTIM